MDDKFRVPTQAIPRDIVEAVKTVSLNKTLDGVTIAGSMTNTMYPFFSDVDCAQVWEYDTLEKAVQGLQHTVQRVVHSPNIQFVELKAGIDSRLVLLPPKCWIEHGRVLNWDLKYSLGRLEDMKKDKLLTDAEYTEWREELEHAGEKCSPTSWVDVQGIDPWKVRWTASQVSKNKVPLRQGSMTLQEALASRGLVKLDASFWSESQQRFLDLSIIYTLSVSTTSLAPRDTPPPVLSLKQDAFIQFQERNAIKLAKRVMSLCVYLDKPKQADVVRGIVVSDAGRAAQIVSDCDTLDTVLDSFDVLPASKIKAEIEGIQFRAANVWGLGLKEKGAVVRACESIADTPLHKLGLQALRAKLDYIEDQLEPWYQEKIWSELKVAGLLPLPAELLP